MNGEVEDEQIHCTRRKKRTMSYISDYEHGGDEFEYEQCAAEENRRDRIEREEYYRGEAYREDQDDE